MTHSEHPNNVIYYGRDGDSSQYANNKHNGADGSYR